ncbi:IS4 family transposase [Algibacter sp. 2305UL17-15]|uniref:IS4 family transposase n=1 Tax=Algibacter sp. 2305UL17-15 TaxID=3231268 RepID=UPI0034580890
MRLELIATDLLLSGSSTVNKASGNHASKTAFYRTLKNKRFDHNDVLLGSFRKCSQNIDVGHVLCIQDTTEFNYNHVIDKIGKDDADIGPTTNKDTAGLFCHPVLVCDPSGLNIYGLGSASIYNRKWDQKDKYERNYQQLPIEQKESYRWIENAQNARSLISKDVNITVIGDRESDIYEEFVQLSDSKTDLLVRSRVDRIIEGPAKKLYSKISEQPLAGTSSVELSGNKSRTKRTALLEIRYCEVEIRAPKTYKGPQRSFKLHAVEAREVTPNLPKDQDPILWRIITTHKVNNLEQARQCIAWYKQRWLIEELFRVMKTKGFKIESSQLGSGSSIKKLISFTLEAALNIMRIKLALGSEHNMLADMVFTDRQIIFMSLLNSRLEGKTTKQKNPYKNKSLAWASWIIARLGKWSGYKSHGPLAISPLKMDTTLSIINIKSLNYSMINKCV